MQNHRKIHPCCITLVLPAHLRESRCNQCREY
nr:MAG TPA: hypothetical protein [Bacteriophage sp.]